jgi:hypothetical protein
LVRGHFAPSGGLPEDAREVVEGVEVESSADVEAGPARLRNAGLAAFDEKDTTCCYALQDKVWVHDPAGAPWELYTVKDDDPTNQQPGTATLNVGG